MPDQPTNPFADALANFSAEAADTTAAETAENPGTPEGSESTSASDDDAGLTLLEILNKELDPKAPGQEPEQKEQKEQKEPDKKDAAKEAAADAGEQEEQESEEDEEQVKKEMGVKAHERFKEIKTTLKTKEQELAAARAELERVRVAATVTGSDEVEKMKAELAAAKQRLAVFDVTSTPEYTTAVAEPLGIITKFVEDVAATYRMDGDELIDALRIADEKSQTETLDRLLSGANVPDRVRLRIYQAANDLPHIWAEKDRLLANADTARDEIEVKRNEAKKAEEAAALEAHATALNEVWDKMELKVLSHLPDADPAAIRKTVAAIKINDMDPEARAFSLYAAVLLPQLQAQLAAAKKEVATYKGKLTKIKGAAPGAGGGQQAPVTPVADDNLSFAEAIERGLRAG
jgi:hypothetical protein